MQIITLNGIEAKVCFCLMEGMEENSGEGD